jgi:hypothetical protein
MAGTRSDHVGTALQYLRDRFRAAYCIFRRGLGYKPTRSKGSRRSCLLTSENFTGECVMADPKSKLYSSWLPLIAVGAGAMVLAERLYLLVDRYAVNIFFSDQWEFNSATVFEQHSLWEIFTWQHGPHRQGLGGVLAKLIEPHFQWDSRIESFLVAGVLVIAMLLAVLLKHRLFHAIDYYDIAIPSLILTATQCEVIFGAANLAHGSMPLLLVMLYCLCWTVHRLIPRLAAVVLVNFVLTFTGFGLLMGAVTPFAILASLWQSAPERRQLRAHLIALALAIASLAIFFHHYVWNPAVDCYGSVLVRRSVGDYLHFASLMFANYFGFDGVSSRHPAVWGAIALASLVICFVVLVYLIGRSRNQQGDPSMVFVVAFALLAFSLCFCAATARGRLCLGFAAAQESRYMPYLTPSFLGFYFLARYWTRHVWVRHVALSVLVLGFAYASWPIHRGDQLEISGFHSGKLNWKNCYLSAKDIRFCTQQTRTRITNPPEAIHLQEKLDFLEKKRLNLFNGR